MNQERDDYGIRTANENLGKLTKKYIHLILEDIPLR